MQWNVMLRYIMLRYVMSCYVINKQVGTFFISCYAMLCYFILCYAWDYTLPHAIVILLFSIYLFIYLLRTGYATLIYGPSSNNYLSSVYLHGVGSVGSYRQSLDTWIAGTCSALPKTATFTPCIILFRLFPKRQKLWIKAWGILWRIIKTRQDPLSQNVL